MAAGNVPDMAPLCVIPKSRAIGPHCQTKAPLVKVLLWTAHFLLLSLAGSAAAQGLIPVPATVTRELGAYYISKLGLAEGGLEYYAILSQRNVGSDNAYLQINGLPAADSPRDAAHKLSNVRGVYTAQSLGGKVTVESFYRLLRCEDSTCFTISRLAAAELGGGAYGPTYPLTLVKTTMGSSSWLINANQGAVNSLLASNGERLYKDAVFKSFSLYHKLVTRPNPCSSALPLTQAGSLAEIKGLPGFTCMNLSGAGIVVATSSAVITSWMDSNALPWSQCNGSMFRMYQSQYNVGPSIWRVIQSPGKVPLTIQIDLPPNTQSCYLFLTIANILRAVLAVRQFPFDTSVGPKDEILPALARLGFNGTCGPRFVYGWYGAFSAGQLEALTEGNPDPDFVASFLPYNTAPPEVCVSMLGQNQPADGLRAESEDQCAQVYFGNESQVREGIITSRQLSPNASASDVSSYKSDVESECASYNLGIDLVLPQIAVDFEAEKNLMASSSEVKFHLDGVAANAASVLAVESALATCGIIVARIIARTGLYRRRRVRSSIARASSMVVAAIVITIFNVPNFALISRSLDNHESQAMYMQVSVHDYRPSNFSAVLRAETYSFVTVQGSRATAVIGLLLYSATMLLCLYLTWTEFTEIIYRREAAESRLGHDALIADKDLLVQWRAADSLVYDTLHPKKVVETARDHELEVMRFNLARAAPAPGQTSPATRETNAGFSPRAAPSPRARVPNAGDYSPLRGPHARSDGLPSGGRGRTPDLYPDV
ncbi:hypothetical protein KFL_001370080 [Klebsormidium nitens]|uniref:Uncharacterized protein n=1 Tax=Klebsormidium nitens TaxID=105231 RepID=A0A1Y1I4U1_KLENI|nr:hypothetical protein KFL_001370080 [Klebsormidium nitens]|eukprot:GAQ83138.1 hypothetical protein KFL_001370080 [Klebsormidium nitens]